jgi:hypothetical protein
MRPWFLGFLLAIALFPAPALARYRPDPFGSPSPLPIQGVTVILDTPGHQHVRHNVTHIEAPPFARSFRAYRSRSRSRWGPQPETSPSPVAW